MQITANIAVVGFYLLIATALFMYCRKRDCTTAEAGAYGLVATLMISSWISQLFLWCGLQRLQPIAFLILLLPIISILAHHRTRLMSEIEVVVNFTRMHPLPVVLLLISVTSIFIFIIWKSIDGIPDLRNGAYPGLGLSWAPLPTLLKMGEDNAAIGLNHIIFSADWQPRTTIPMANLFAYLAISLATYALARRYAWPSTAITVSLLVVGMPRLVHQCFTPHSELLPAASALIALLALFRTVENPQAEDATMLLASLGFSVTSGRLCYLLPSVLAALTLLVLARRHNMRLWAPAMRSHWPHLTVALLALLVFGQLPALLFNLLYDQTWMGELPGRDIAFNPDGIIGTCANMARYLFQAVHLPAFLDDAIQWLFGWRITEAIEILYRLTVDRWAIGRGAAQPFQLSWEASSEHIWFGPFGFLLIMPAMVHALWMGPHRLKTTALAMVCYWLLIALIAAWHPANVRWITPMLVCSGYFTAFILPPWRIGRKGCLLLQCSNLALLVHSFMTHHSHITS